MDKLQSGIRITVRAVIVQDNKILLIKKDSPNEGIRYTLPGGALESGETLHQAVIRECQEEINTPVNAYDVLHIADFFIPKFDPKPYTRHQLEVLIQCQVPSEYSPSSGPDPDKHQVGVEWLPVNELNQHTISPNFFAKLLINLHSQEHNIYVGSVT
ncbi:8-oxo-dGTP diphosphatase [Bathymodiolus platifrons methanotrophic gill symbiont]|nr:NUDIX domain-containing protein [Bathymodiolus platifrons methanotrophic gill symbiont]MCK5869893.1 NUDIX domain-containing protein [Methyloprofundus sp.]TXK95589.1 NUDIX domain-containing protein [Methylococcaceae bacterium CS4]TXK96715.1 NUDIX domain-containing protein [Methylococcaceae bacterium CS5]TXK98294.1 NUDIX domain-containing protein [Methylococcaceae bacterium HT1]TXL06970.1 NUDIX domain-containing protein [Methylococcaceae bacterium CS3]TXL07153.1 NUDIX domain-containing prote